MFFANSEMKISRISYEYIPNENIIVRIRESLSPPSPSKTAVMDHRVFIVLEDGKKGAFLFEKLQKEMKETMGRFSFPSFSLLLLTQPRLLPLQR